MIKQRVVSYDILHFRGIIGSSQEWGIAEEDRMKGAVIVIPQIVSVRNAK